MKKLVAAILSFAVFFCFLPSFAGYAADDVRITVGGEDDGSGYWYPTLADAADSLEPCICDIIVAGTSIESRSAVFGEGVYATIYAADGAGLMRGEGFMGDMIVVNSGAYVTLGNIIISGNAIDCSGRIVNANGGTLFIQNATIWNNVSGGIVINGGSYVTMGGGIINECGSMNVFGGGVYVMNGTFALTGGSIVGNVALNGGGICAWSELATVNVSGGAIESNAAQDGGGIYMYRSTMDISGGIIASNNASNCGGGIANSGMSIILFQKDDGIRGTINCAGGCISGNTARYGSGIYLNCENYSSNTSSVFASAPKNVSHILKISDGASILDDNDVYLALAQNTLAQGDVGAYVTVTGQSEEPACVITPQEYRDGLKVSEGSDNIKITPKEDYDVAVVNGCLSVKEKKYLPGDANKDGNINIVDALMTLRVAAKLATADAKVFSLMDMDGDDTITVADALAVLRISVGLAK